MEIFHGKVNHMIIHFSIIKDFHVIVELNINLVSNPVQKIDYSTPAAEPWTNDTPP